jgi:hypothetical protein
MPFDINRFRSELIGDGARPNLFQVSVAAPPGIAAAVPTRTTFMIKSAQLPGSTVGTVPLFYFGRELKFAGNRTFPDWTVTVINDETFDVRNFFERWMSGLNSHAGNLREGSNSPTAYTTDLEVLQYGKADASREIKKYKFVGAFPTDVSPIDLDWGSNDTIEEFTVTFSYQWWESNTTDTVGSPQTNVLGQGLEFP